MTWTDKGDGVQVEYPFSADPSPASGTVTYAFDDDRLRLEFDTQIPTEAFREIKRAWRWSRRLGLFQRKLTDNAVYAAKTITGLDLPRLAEHSFRRRRHTAPGGRSGHLRHSRHFTRQKNPRAGEEHRSREGLR